MTGATEKDARAAVQATAVALREAAWRWAKCCTEPVRDAEDTVTAAANKRLLAAAVVFAEAKSKLDWWTKAKGGRNGRQAQE